jgi:paraquat-inducible protein A
MTTALQRGYAVCHLCLGLSPADEHLCARCGSKLHARVPDSVQQTIALIIAAIILYIPANMLPIMITDQFGRATESTIIGGVLLLWKLESYPVAIIILVASVLVPLGKIASLAVLCWTVKNGMPATRQQRTVLYRITEFVGKWSMVDVFVVAVLVALIQIGGIIAIRPGSAALAFAGVVIVTMIAAERFDPRLIWDQESDNQ